MRAPNMSDSPGQCSNHSPSLYPLSSQLTRETGGAGVLTARRVMMQHEQSFSESKRLCGLAAWQKEEGEDGREQVGSLNRPRICVVGVTEDVKCCWESLRHWTSRFAFFTSLRRSGHKLPSMRRAGEARSGRFSPRDCSNCVTGCIKTRKSWGSAFTDACIRSPLKDP